MGRKSIYLLIFGIMLILFGCFANQSPNAKATDIEHRQESQTEPTITEQGTKPMVLSIDGTEVPVTWEANPSVADLQKYLPLTIDFNITEKPVVSAYIDNAWHYGKDTSPNGGRRDLLVSKSIRLIPTEKIKAPTLIMSVLRILTFLPIYAKRLINRFPIKRIRR